MTNGECILGDGADMLRDKLCGADGIVLSSPVDRRIILKNIYHNKDGVMKAVDNNLVERNPIKTR